MWTVQFGLPKAIAPVVSQFSGAEQAYRYYHYQVRVGGLSWIELVNPAGEVVLSAYLQRPAGPSTAC